MELGGWKEWGLTDWEEVWGNFLGWRLGHHKCIHLLKFIQQYTWDIYFTVFKFASKEKKVNSKHWAQVSDMHAEILRGKYTGTEKLLW